MRVFRLASAAIFCFCLLVGGAGPSASAGSAVHAAPATSGFTLVGSNALLNRGENSALAIYDHYAYIGSRTDTSQDHIASGVMVVDIADPTNPAIAGLADVDPPSLTSRELRVWPQQKILIVMWFQCSAALHQCTSNADAQNVVDYFSFYDLTNPAMPTLITQYRPSSEPHEMFLWVDPTQPDKRALLYWTSVYGSSENLVVTDISNVRKTSLTDSSAVTDIGSFNSDPAFGGPNSQLGLHSIGVSIDGTQTYMAVLAAGFVVVDSSDFALGKPNPQFRYLTPVHNRVRSATKWGTHTAVKVPGQPYVLTTDEVYGSIPGLPPAGGGCPWGWARLIDISDVAHPKVASDYKIAQNDPSYCSGVSQQTNMFTSYASHNPTIAGPIAFVTWHSGGLQAINLEDPTHPKTAGAFVPTPLAAVATEDSMLSIGGSQVVMWSYPIIRNGLIYVVDIRNGLYILKYTGPHANEVAQISFLEGNSNLGDASRLDQGDQNKKSASFESILRLAPRAFLGI
jgi:hypothetical protein